MLVLEVLGPDRDGDVWARPAKWEHEEPPPRLRLIGRGRGPAPGLGDQVLARIAKADEGLLAQPIRTLARQARRVLGIYEVGAEGGRLRPTDKRQRDELTVAAADAGGAQPGELVEAEMKGRRGRLGLRQAKVVERLGRADTPSAIGLIALHEQGIPTDFPKAAVAEAEAAGPCGPEGRTDLRSLPLVTIDGEDARDFDDAVFAEPDPARDNPDGWHLIVAIADVAHYVRADGPLDREARRRGNSVYLPGRVVPMLPEALSNGWCSLRPGEDRPVLAAHLRIDAEGRLIGHRFERALMRSAARLTYTRVQAAADGGPDAQLQPLMKPVIRSLYGAFRALARSRAERGALDIDLPERQVELDEEGRIKAIHPRPRFDSHRLIEEFMIAANVAAAETLERRKSLCIYRIHDDPDPLKLEAIRPSLKAMGLSLPHSPVVRPSQLNLLLNKAEEAVDKEVVHELILRAQSQAVYSVENIGHYGLALQRYAHFTSPIRRYADLIVHRSLVHALGLGAGGLESGDSAALAEIAEHISQTERRAQAAERDTMDRLTAGFLAERVDTELPVRVTSVTRHGLFVRHEATGAEGLLPMSLLPEDFYELKSAPDRLVGRHTGRRFGLGERFEAKLVEANPLSGGLLFRLDEGPQRTRERSQRTRRR